MPNATHTAALAASVYALFLVVFVYRDIGMNNVPEVLVDFSRVTAPGTSWFSRRPQET
jgi:TRAP-type C4-dicarboxylate transport system permease large subunit